MAKLAVIGTIEVQPGAREEVLRAVLAHRDRCLKDELGTLQFEVLVPSEDSAKPPSQPTCTAPAWPRCVRKWEPR
jgi:quinol monooxygenase YgiN